MIYFIKYNIWIVGLLDVRKTNEISTLKDEINQMGQKLESLISDDTVSTVVVLELSKKLDDLLYKYYSIKPQE